MLAGLVRVGRSLGVVIQFEIVVGHPSCVAVSFFFILGLQFVLYVCHKLQCFVVMDFILYISMYWCVSCS